MMSTERLKLHVTQSNSNRRNKNKRANSVRGGGGWTRTNVFVSWCGIMRGKSRGASTACTEE